MKHEVDLSKISDFFNKRISWEAGGTCLASPEDRTGNMPMSPTPLLWHTHSKLHWLGHVPDEVPVDLKEQL